MALKYVAPFVALQLCSVITYEITFPTLSLNGHSSVNCRTSTGGYGRCLELKTCPYVIQSLLKGVKPTNCGFNNSMPIVCCPLLLAQNVTSRLTRLDEVTAPKTSNICGYRGFIEYDPNDNSNDAEEISARHSAGHTVPPPLVTDKADINFTTPGSTILSVAGGVQSFRNSWPWMALLGRRRGADNDFFCSAIIINENFVVTAAHCVLGLEPFFVRFGEHDYSPNVGHNLFELTEDVNVDKVIFHPLFDLTRGYHDIALLKLARNISIRNEVSPICLPWGGLIHKDLVGEQVTVTGWGKEAFDGLPSTILQEVNLTVFDPSICESSYSTLRDFGQKFPQGMNHENIVCAGDTSGGKDACEGDSGGPMVHHNKDDDSYTLSGIISKGFGCGKKEFPGLYAPLRNANTLRWIKETAF